jgi:peptide/nickel transport system permease protein
MAGTAVPDDVQGDVGVGSPLEPATGWRRRGRFLSRLRRYAAGHPLFIVGGVIVTVTLFLAAFGPLVAPYDPVRADSSVILQAPSAAHWFGTDESGFDIFSRTIVAPRIDVTIALIATLLSLSFGSVIGLLASYFEGVWGNLVMRSADVVQAFPLFVLAMILVTTSGRNLASLIFVIAFLNVPIFIRLMRSQVLALKHRSFVESARAVGNSELSVAFRHVMPNALEPGLIQTSVTMGFAILLTAGLSFIGAGVRPPTPEWGAMIASGAQSLPRGAWWPSVFPGIVMSMVVFGFATVAEGFREMLRGGSRGT